jgi:hypothetical protein
MFEQQLAGLQMCQSEWVFFCEHDVLYPKEHFLFLPDDPDVVWYNEHVWKVDLETGRAISYDVKQVSGMMARRDLLLKHYTRRVELVRANGFSRRMGFEPGTHGRRERVDALSSKGWRSTRPLVDIRHGKNLTPSRWTPEEFRDRRNCQNWREADEVPGWGKELLG